MNTYEAKCEHYFPDKVDGEDSECQNYQLKTDAPYGSCTFCQNYMPKKGENDGTRTRSTE